ncbi:hypothetical protein COW36_15025 [bacterium (Candidatus Blackallbacteria) CG17_big_fil_post_rev_8_21_14_2_50_48_46]|uniref:Uncharacterized protein n=1 Tax=bacterium (Candidatus Blackallbacteria) CG17_big_fil_post_rev_8_21_14_2_50_48_46 TaxID=2014261 RepID=A0A2M7G3I8_9BACT|nr:MAG: hypothetical protein COW64_11525 [bacterium (Candidatus Blackallbacteria) CG18_big_fil_WC_8_21_14_2_50_49_26]PIW16022.1 MAG: hypothetical protein COW36_15025 [bacterium (Candidatus Blackallbacteria) CG17_big_fil_post_rev_8_21_14_2_50_48_46]PIW50434.1 MAG: hypothetical protein COW20_02740 [bacterium (Candidatus Blackallbacteria) CG13_big_fil_rev_8_21_14_2_50_49_14]
MRKTFLASTALMLLTACGSQMQTQAYNPYMMGQTGAYGAGAYGAQTGAYGTNYQQNLYQQPGAIAYNAQTATANNTQMSSFASTTASQSASAINAPLAQNTARKTTNTASTATVKRAATPTKTASAAIAPKATAPSVSPTQSLLEKTKARFEQIQNFRAMADVFETKAGKGPVKAKIKVTFQKPGNSKLEIIDHSNSLYKGAKLTYKSGIDSITGRPGGAMSFMKMTLPMSDDKVTSRRGYRLDQVDTLAIVSRLIRPELNPKLLGKTTVNGRPVAVLEYQATNHFDPTITKELLGIDMETYFVRIHEMYAGSELVYSLKLPDVQFNQPMTAADLDV